MANFDINKLVMESVMDLEEATANDNVHKAAENAGKLTGKAAEGISAAKDKVTGAYNSAKDYAGDVSKTATRAHEDVRNEGDPLAKAGTAIKRGVEDATPGQKAAAAALGAGLGGVALARKLRNRRK
ncbi:MAG: hypothetical protein ACOCZ5_00835 [bacterium]